MANLIDRVLLGGAFVCSGLIHRKVGQVAERVEHVERVQDDTARTPFREETAGMPLPTGYGIQVTGPGDEDIVIPICLPPGFELASLVIVPSFLPDGEVEGRAAAAPAAVAPPRSDEPTPAAVPASPPAERLEAGMRLVYGDSPEYSAHLDQVPAPTERVRELPPLRESVL